ncbi:MAG TPA: hypothetical protein VHZ25_02115 [Acidobacteriaceae bacterium]|nr:hypothetical protein [Acidobacteriaceae bacterium]
MPALPAGTHIHVSSDKKSHTCYFQSADDASLVCSGKRGGGRSYSFARSEVRSVKLTRYTVSTLVGMGIGAGLGVGIGAAVSPKSSSNTLDFSGLDREVDIGLGAVIGFLAGGAVGGPTDFLRGPVVYRRAGL